MKKKDETPRSNVVRMTPDYYTSYIDSKILAARIQSYWQNKGYPKVKVWVETEADLNSDRKFHNIRSNISFNVKDAEVGRFI
jgi:hypothetical protein